MRHDSLPPTRHTTPRPAVSNILDGHAENADDSSSDAENPSITDKLPTSSTSGPHKKAHSKPDKKESTRGRNRSDLPQKYNTPNTRFDDRFLPEVQYLYGLESDPWSRPALALVQRARDKVFTEFQDTLTTKSPVFRNVRASQTSFHLCFD